MSLVYIAGGLAGLMAVAIIVVGACYFLVPAATAASFGLPATPEAGAVGWLEIKGVRDIVTGVLGLALLASGQFSTLGWFLLIAALIPIGDAIVVLRHSGSKKLAYGMHGATAAAMVILAPVLQLG